MLLNASCSRQVYAGSATSLRHEIACCADCMLVADVVIVLNLRRFEVAVYPVDIGGRRKVTNL